MLLIFFTQHIGSYRYEKPEGVSMTMIAAKLNKKEVIQAYSRIAFFYDVWGSLTESKARRRALQLAAIQDGESVLEVAVGTGLAFREIVRMNPNGQNFGIDLTQAMLDKAREKIGQTQANFRLSIGDAYDLRFENAQFDVLINNYMFDLLPEADFITVLNEFRRVLKPGGRLVLINMTKGERFYQNFYEFLYQINPRWMGGCRGVLLANTLSKAGFKNISREMTSQLGFPSEILTATL
jgi:ubiquinone/menaquinone biosynthesis C-methylase UbiE